MTSTFTHSPYSAHSLSFLLGTFSSSLTQSWKEVKHTASEDTLMSGNTNWFMNGHMTRAGPIRMLPPLVALIGSGMDT